MCVLGFRQTGSWEARGGPQTPEEAPRGCADWDKQRRSLEPLPRGTARQVGAWGLQTHGTRSFSRKRRGHHARLQINPSAT